MTAIEQAVAEMENFAVDYHFACIETLRHKIMRKQGNIIRAKYELQLHSRKLNYLMDSRGLLATEGSLC